MRVVGVIKLVGRVLAKDVQSSLMSDSSSVASYRSSNGCIWRCHSVSEQEDRDPADIGEKNRCSLDTNGSPLVLSFNWGGCGGGGCEGCGVVCLVLDTPGAVLSEYCASRASSSIVSSLVPRTCRRGGHLGGAGRYTSVMMLEYTERCFFLRLRYGLPN